MLYHPPAWVHCRSPLSELKKFPFCFQSSPLLLKIILCSIIATGSHMLTPLHQIARFQPQLHLEGLELCYCLLFKTRIAIIKMSTNDRC